MQRAHVEQLMANLILFPFLSRYSEKNRWQVTLSVCSRSITACVVIIIPFYCCIDLCSLREVSVGCDVCGSKIWAVSLDSLCEPNSQIIGL